ncbi:hypothetical protein [Cellulomonas biazotea]|uniref:Gram-positive cocci surface proteins LPxTG domain-containing protein n=1 Tax=Cellulomonas biazotea TaxID=1709 RepID=A0A402DWH5_9CELL|nr:hypothetical protein [Cellulomonas biazotea]GCE78491.1 hypothetical protein CBZ_35470 [Cellulomonas biazotea]
MLHRAAAAVSLACLLLGGSAAAAHAGGSDDPTPYTVTAEGLTLPAGRTFVEHDHVNVRYVVDGETRSAMLHVQAATAQGAFAGRGDVRWSELGLPERYCVTWVEVSGYNEHFGEGGQRPVCTSDTTPPPRTAVPVAPIPAEPATPPGSDATPTPTPTPEPSPSVSGAVLDTSPGATPSATPSATPDPRAEVLAAGDGPSRGGLAITGSDVLIPVLGVGTAALAAGIVLRSLHRRSRGTGPAHRR